MIPTSSIRIIHCLSRISVMRLGLINCISCMRLMSRMRFMSCMRLMSRMNYMNYMSLMKAMILPSILQACG